MDINWSRYIEIARAQDLGSAEVARLIRTETRRKVNISEVKRRLSVSESAAAQIRQPNREFPAVSYSRRQEAR